MKIVKAWWLIVLCFVIVMAYFMPMGIETVYPIIDWKGGNRLNMEVNKDTDKGEFYHCGETVVARFKLQKQREAVGQIKWELIRNSTVDNPEQIYLYPPRIAASPVGIVDHWAKVEILPSFCLTGSYHFRGTMAYPSWLGGNLGPIYTIRTKDFEVKGKE